MDFASFAQERAPGFSCFGEQRGIIARATRERPSLLDRFVALTRPGFHSVAAYMGLIGRVTTADDMQAVLDIEPAALLAMAFGSSCHESLYAEVFPHLPDRFLSGDRYVQLARIVEAGLGARVLDWTFDDIEGLIEFWGRVVVLADDTAVALAPACFPDAEAVGHYVRAIREARESGLLNLSHEDLRADLSRCVTLVDVHAFFYRMLLAREMPSATVSHPAFRPVHDVRRLWKKRTAVWHRRKLAELLGGTSILLEYAAGGGDADQRPLILIDQVAGLATGYQIFEATAEETEAIEALLPGLAPALRWPSLARVLGATLNEYAGRYDFHILGRYHRVAR